MRSTVSETAATPRFHSRRGWLPVSAALLAACAPACSSSGGKAACTGAACSDSDAGTSDAGTGASGVVWTAKDLGAGRCVSINAAGTVLGLDDQNLSFTIAADGTKTMLPAPSSGSALGVAIGSAGLVVGYLTGSNGVRTAARFDGTAWAPITGVGTSWTSAIGVGPAGEIAGVAGAGVFGELRAFLLAGGAAQTLALPADRGSAAYLINGSGVVAGIVESASGDTHTFVISGGKLTDLAPLSGKTSNPRGINGSGDIAGVAADAAGVFHAFWSALGAAAVDLGVPAGMASSDATGIDDKQRVAGNGYDAAGASHAVVFQSGKALIDLTPKDDTGAAWRSSHAAAMTGDGRIVGFGSPPAGGVHCLLWTPGS